MAKRARALVEGRSKRAILHLTLHRDHFDAIAGEKKTEYRDNSPYWRSRLLDRTYHEIHFSKWLRRPKSIHAGSMSWHPQRQA